MDISEELKISVYHEGLLLLMAYSSFEDLLPLLSQNKRDGVLIHDITQLSDGQLVEKYKIKDVHISGTSSWSSFLQELQIVCRKHREVHGLVLGAIIELMDELNWQDTFNIRKFLTLFLHTNEELAHLKIAVAGTKYRDLEYWRSIVIEEAQGYAAYKSKIA